MKSADWKSTARERSREGMPPAESNPYINEQEVHP